MCGISAVVSRTASAETAVTLQRMHAPIAHRGPDGERLLLWTDFETTVVDGGALPRDRPATVGLAFRRLKIVDLSDRASQPMRSARSGTWLVFNGEIYNYRTLRDELRRAGREFTTESDSEVVLAAYDEWGTECFRRFAGMWAIVLLDVRGRRVIASRDRLGIKPLYWAMDGNRLLLASEIRQIVAATGRPVANLPLVHRYLRGNRIPCYDETFFEGIRSVPAASWFEVPVDGQGEAMPRFRRYWSLRDASATPVNGNAGERYGAVRQEFENLLRETIASHRQGDVPVGSLLSGGLDSSVLAAILADSDPAPLATFSFGFRERAPELCELRYVDAIVKTRRNMAAHETTLDSDWLAANAPRVIVTLEEPPLALPALAQYRVFELCRQHGVTVVLDGEGADEVLAGYAPYQRALLIDCVLSMKPLRFASELRAIAQRQERSSAGLLYDFFVAPVMRRLRGTTYDWLAPQPVPEKAEEIDRSRDPSLVNRMLYNATFWGNVKVILGYTDRNSMAHSVEARVPFMDHRVVEHAFSLPAEFKVGNGDRKRVLRDLGRELLPPVITERKDRMGFATPDAALMSGRFAEAIHAAVTDESLARLPLFHVAALRRFVDAHRAGEHFDLPDLRALWRVYALAVWRNEFNVRM